MPRRAEIQVREVSPDPVYNSQLVTQVINKVMTRGKRSSAERIVYNALDRVLARALGEDRQRVVDDALGGRLLAVEHHAVDDLLHQLGAVQGIRLGRPDGGGGAAGHRYFAFTPYCERAFLRSDTPAASRVPRTTL